MKCIVRLAIILLAGLFASVAAQTCVGQGGHGGGGHGFGSHGGGHASHGLSPGKTSGHQVTGRSIGRSIAHFFTDLLLQLRILGLGLLQDGISGI